MKNDFANQVVNYNTSIANKIDGAIAAYLAGLQLSKKQLVHLDSKTNYTFPLVMQSDTDMWNDPYSNYYNVARNRTRHFTLKNLNFCAQFHQATNAVYWNDENITAITSVPAGNKNDKNIFGIMQERTTDITPRPGELYWIEQTGETRNLIRKHMEMAINILITKKS